MLHIFAVLTKTIVHSTMVDMQLYFLVFGESLLNDGVTVVLYNTMIALGGLEVVEYMQYILAFFRNWIKYIFLMPF